MYLSKIRVKNYKSFRDSGEIEFKPGINIIVGQNNSGKTALLEAISLRFTDKPHKNEELATSGNTSIVELVTTIEKEELDQLKKDPAYKTIIIPQPKNNDIGFALAKFNSQIKSALNIRASFKELNLVSKSLSHEIYEERQESTNNRNMQIHLSSTMNEYVIVNESKDRIAGANSQDTIGWKLMFPFTKRIYRFDAERTNLSSCLVGTDRILKPNGSNLAEVLSNTDSNNDDLYDEFNKYVSEVLPIVKRVKSVRIETPQPAPTPGAWNEVRIWTVDIKKRREDLAFPLSECGTGIGQVLAILYVVITSKEPRTIIIDEPNSFLHPGAAKKLIQILNKFPQHQYFISTHSPEILAVAKPSTITRLKYLNGETIAQRINLEQTQDLKETLLEIGVKFSDVFFSENILWVEGPTEATTFPLILEQEKELFDVTFLPLVNTGDFESRRQARKNAVLAFEIYNRLSGAHALTPPFVAVVFDKEEKNEQEIKELERLSSGKAKFIPRRMYENYLLDSEAIAEILNQELTEVKFIKGEEINTWILEKRERREYLAKRFEKKTEIKDKEWLENVDGAKLLYDLFSHFSGKTVEYRKTTHSVKLTQWLLEHKPQLLSELKAFLLDLLSTDSTSL